MASSQDDRGSTLLLDEYFNDEDPRFLDELRKLTKPPQLAAFAQFRWRKDPRPWARRQIFAYLELPFDRPGHNPVVKRLFKQAEENRDDELMAAFLVAFDRLERRAIKKKNRWDSVARASYTEESLRSRRDLLMVYRTKNPRTGEVIEIVDARRGAARIFSHPTRTYLRRRAWRYFRRMGFQRPNDYVAAIARALARYADADLPDGLALLDSWGLMHACFRRSEALRFGRTHITLATGRTLAELSPAPRFPPLWQETSAGAVLLSLVTDARARPVRVWAMRLLREHHANRLGEASPEFLLRLLDHADEEVQNFGADLLRTARGLESLPVAAWLRLLETRNATALGFVCEAMAKHVSAERLGFAQRLKIACAQPTPVARMGLAFLRTQPPANADERRALSAAADARCSAVAVELANWVLSLAGAPATYEREVASALLDSADRGIRAAAWDWLTGDSPGKDDAVLWSRLVETPHDELRLRLIDTLDARATLPGTKSEDLAPVWSAVLLGVLRGGRRKPKAVRQLARALVEDPSRANALLPVLAVAVRSVRAPEMRAGLAAAVAAAQARPELAEAIGRHLPELVLPR